MQHIEAGKSLMSLIQGRNRASGECLPSECVVRNADIIRALLFCVGARRRLMLERNGRVA